MAPTPVSVAAPIEQFICKPDEPVVLKETQLSTYLMNVMRRNAELGPDDPAQINGETGKLLTYQQFLEQAVRTAEGIRALGVVPGDAISVMARNMNYTFTTNVSIYLTGILLHPMYPYLEPELVMDQIHKIKPRVIFAESHTLDRIRAAIKGMSPKPRVVVLDSDNVDADMMTIEEVIHLGSKVDVENFEEAYVENPEEESGLIIFTTGSTGPPKPVVHTSRSILYFARAPRNLLKDSVMFGPLMSWITGQGTMLVSMNDRVTIVYSVEPTLDKVQQMIKDYKLKSCMSSPFSVLQMALRGVFPDHLERIVVGGSPMRHPMEKAIRNALPPNASLMPVYGSTELCLMAGLAYKEDDVRQYTNGRLAPGTELQIRDLRTGRPVGPNQRGEIFIRSPTRMKGYLNNSELTSSFFDEHGWAKTGDYGYYDEDSFIYVFDRLKDIIYYKDAIILPSELTDVIRLHPSVADAAVSPIPHPEDRQHPVAFVSLKPGKTLTEEELNEHILKHCDDSCRLRGGVVFLERIPRTLSGKVQSTAILEKVQQMLEAPA